MLKRNGVFLTVLFALSVTVGSVSYTFYQLYQTNRSKHTDTLFTKYSLISQIYHSFLLKQISLPVFEANLAMHDLYVVNDTYVYETITRHSYILKEDHASTIAMERKMFMQKSYQLSPIHARMLLYQGKIYFWIYSVHYPVLLEDRSAHPYKGGNLLYAYFSIIGILLLSFGLIIYRLSPLRRLRRQIAKFGEGDMEVSFQIDGQDEIALVARELETTRSKIRALIDSRTLFLRNIMHELKTPIAKGRIAAMMLGDPKHKSRFESIFERLESLIAEFALIEEISSGSQSLEKKGLFRLIDIIDGAIDMAMVDYDAVKIEITSGVMVEANYRLFATAIKNMIDNGLKYSDKGSMRVSMENRAIVFLNHGVELKHPLEYYVEPFTKERPTKDSFGLGLYIVNAILQEHGYSLAYERRGEENCFLFVPDSRMNIKG